MTSAGFSVRLPKEIKFINNETNSIDIALLEFQNERLSLLKTRYSFLSYRNIEFGHDFDEDFFYMLFGFINKKTMLKNCAFDAQAFGFLTNTRNFKNVAGLGFNYKENVTLEYNRRKQNDMYNDIRKMGPRELKGLSGGGIWLSKAGKKANTFQYVLVGIMIEERLDRGFIIGTKIGIIQNELN